MSATIKTHAKDYLLEYLDRKDVYRWLKSLISKVVDADGVITDEEKDKIFEELLKENSIQLKGNVKVEQIQPTLYTTSSAKTKTLILEKVTHISGVNALASNESIAFSPECTVIFGLNGTGKSGYFKIINELAGGTKTKSILGNIYSPPQNFQVDIDFLLNGNGNQPYQWKDSNDRGIYPFDSIDVFDSDYMPIFLNERESSVNIEPLGLNLFRIIVNYIKDYKNKLENLRKDVSEQLPDLQPLIDSIKSNDIKALLQQQEISKEELESLTSNTFNDSDRINLNNLINEKSTLEKVDSASTKALIEREKKEIDELIKDLENLKSKLESTTKEVAAAIEDYINKKKTRDERVKEFEILKKIPLNNTQEWSDFIEKAEEYSANINTDDGFDKENNCVYCHQTLSDDALKLVHTYSKYLQDQSQQNFKLASEKIKSLEEVIKDIEGDMNISETTVKILEDSKDSENISKKQELETIQMGAHMQKQILETGINELKKLPADFSLKIESLTDFLSTVSEDKQKQIDKLGLSSLEKDKRLTDISGKINELQDKDNLSKWNQKIKNYFESKEKIQNYLDLENSINTRGITELGAKAHEELLTESIRASFEDELKALGKDIEITLEKTSASKGKVKTRLKIHGNDAKSVLSDGEQKAAVLALFIAEIENQTKNVPVVFDDPVTSIDHEVADFLAQRLLRLSTSRQVIIFTHNKLFYDSIVYWCSNLKDKKGNKTHHLCKNYGNGNMCKGGCHVYTYKVDKESKEITGRIFEAQNESCRYYIDRAREELKINYSLSAVAGYLKSGIEHFIDEKVLNNQGLVKDQKIKGHIEWEMLKGLNPDVKLLDQLKEHWDDLSNRGTHLTAQSSQNPMKLQELQTIINYLEQNL